VLKKEIDVFQIQWYGYCMFMKMFERGSDLINLLSSHAESFIDIYRQVQYTVRYKTTKYKADTLNTKVKKLRHQLQLFVESTRLC
jgi:hypothetical protein